MVDDAASDSAQQIAVQVILAIDTRCWQRSLDIVAGSTAGQALTASGLLEVCRAETGRAPVSLGIFGRKITADYVLQDGERLELYRALVADPRQRRRERAAGD